MINTNLKRRTQTAIILIILLALMIKFNLISVYILLIFGTISILEFLKISQKIFKTLFIKYFVNLIFTIYLFSFCYFFFFFSNFIDLKIILYVLILGCIASDIGGFVIGKLFKGPKITKISPNKTYSGALGSILLTCFVMTCLVVFFSESFSYLIIIISIITSIGCQLGDLFFSFLKRKAKIKDTGSFLPGHGGILDRVDGILLGIPFGFIAMILVY